MKFSISGGMLSILIDSLDVSVEIQARAKDDLLLFGAEPLPDLEVEADMVVCWEVVVDGRGNVSLLLILAYAVESESNK